MGEMLLHSSAFIFGWIFIVIACNKVNALMSLNFCQIPPPATAFNFNWTIFILAGNKDSNKILDGFKIQQDQTRTGEVSYPACLEKNYRLKLEKSCEHSSAFNFVWIFIVLAGNQDNYKSLDEFKFCQIPSPATESAALEHLKNQCITV